MAQVRFIPDRASPSRSSAAKTGILKWGSLNLPGVTQVSEKEYTSPEKPSAHWNMILKAEKIHVRV